MTSPTPMTREELLDLAALDALGLLEPYEAALYTRSFHHAPAAVQDEIKRLQAEIASDESLLPDEQPSVELRSRVLAAVSKAIEQVDSDLAPIASIGPNRPPALPTQSPATTGGTAIFWRAATFTLAASLVVVLYFFVEAKQDNTWLRKFAYNEVTQQQLNDHIGPDYMAFINGDSQQAVLHPTEGNGGSTACVYVKPNGEAYMLALGLPKGAGPYELQMTDEMGGTHTVASFDPGQAGINGLPIQVSMFSRTAQNAVAAAAASWRIVDATGSIILQSA